MTGLRVMAMPDVTPGRAAYEARRRSLWSRHGMPDGGLLPAPWDGLTDGQRADEEAGAAAAWAPERDRLSAALAEVASLRDQLAGQSSQRNRLVGDYNELDDRHATLLEEVLRNADEDINGGDEAPEYLAEAYVRFLERERDEAAASYRALEARNAETCAVLAEARDFISRLERTKAEEGL
jgi:hypothetical protein